MRLPSASTTLTGADALNVNGAIGVTGNVNLQSGQNLTLNSNTTTTGNVTLQADTIAINQNLPRAQR